MTDNPMPKGLWTPRTIEETQRIYADWAANYEADVGAAGYATPGRVAAALAAHLPDRAAPVLDFGCGTGLAGEALAAAGFTQIDGTDISAEMLAVAGTKPVYRALTKGDPDTLPDATAYAAVTATGVVSLGAAPAETLDALLAKMAPGALLVFSYNEATLRAADFLEALARVQGHGTARLIWAEYGPHLPQMEGAEGSTVYVLQRL